jgi:hypothetical protein
MESLEIEDEIDDSPDDEADDDEDGAINRNPANVTYMSQSRRQASY